VTEYTNNILHQVKITTKKVMYIIQNFDIYFLTINILQNIGINELKINFFYFKNVYNCI